MSRACSAVSYYNACMKSKGIWGELRRHRTIWMGVVLTLTLWAIYSLGSWYAHLPDALSYKAYVPTVAFIGNQIDAAPRPVAAGATGCGSISTSLAKVDAGQKNFIYRCSSAGREVSYQDGKLVFNLSTSDPNLEFVPGGSACNVHYYQGGQDIRSRHAGGCFTNITEFTGGGSRMSAENGMWCVNCISGAALACTVKVKINGSPTQCGCVYASTGSVNAPPCTPSNNPNAGEAPPPAAPTSPPAQTAPLTIPQVLTQGKACGEHTESDYTCSKDRLSHTVRHMKYCENGAQKFMTLLCDGAGESRSWVDITSQVLADKGKYASTLGGCDELNLSCPPVTGSANPTQPPAATAAPRPTDVPAPTAAPQPTAAPPLATPTPIIPTLSPQAIAPVSSQGILQVSPLSIDSTYYLSFSTVPGNVAFGLYFANGGDISLENQINNALALQGISVPSFKNLASSASVYELPFLINDPSTRLNFTLYRRPKKDASQSFTLSTFIEQSKGCLSTAMPNTYVIDVTTLQSNTPCR